MYYSIYIFSQFVESNVTLDALANSISRRDSDSVKIRDSLDFAEICVNNLQTTTAGLDNDAMQASRMWEALVTASSQTSDPYYNRSFSSGRVAFSVPSPYFDALASRSLTESTTIDSLAEELSKIEDYFVSQFKEGRRPTEIDEKVRAALVHKIHELKSASNKQ